MLIYISKQEHADRISEHAIGICMHSGQCCFKRQGDCHLRKNPRCEMRLSVREAAECRRERTCQK